MIIKPFLVFVLSIITLTSANASAIKDELFRQTSRNHKSFSYAQARRILFNDIHLKKDRDGYFIEGVYCQRKHYPFGGAAPGERLPNANKFNTEHTWPQSKFSRHFSKSTQKTDMHHLYPTFSKINSERGNLPFAEVTRGRKLSCHESQIGSARNTRGGNYFEPPSEHKGNVARAIFYFSVRYKMPLDGVQERYLRNWHREDPVDRDERERNETISRHQRNRNPFIDSPELVDQVEDF
jgi:deoxyribonuclease I